MTRLDRFIARDLLPLSLIILALIFARGLAFIVSEMAQ